MHTTALRAHAPSFELTIYTVPSSLIIFTYMNSYIYEQTGSRHVKPGSRHGGQGPGGWAGGARAGGRFGRAGGRAWGRARTAR